MSGASNAGALPANLVRAMDVNPLEGLPTHIYRKLLADTTDTSVDPPTEEELQIIEDHTKKSAEKTYETMVAMLRDKPQAVHTLEQSTGLTPIMIACQSGTVSHVKLLMRSMKEWKEQRETEEWAKEDAQHLLSITVAGYCTGAGSNINSSGSSAECQTSSSSLSSSSSPSPGCVSSPCGNVVTGISETVMKKKGAYSYQFRNPTINRHDASGYAPIHHVVYSGNVEVLEALLGEDKDGDVDANNDSGRSPITQNESKANKTQGNGVDVNLSTVYVPSMKPTGETPLHIAARLAGASPSPAPKSICDAKEGNSTSAVEDLSQSPDIAIVRLLLKHGAMVSLNARDDRGRTPLSQIKEVAVNTANSRAKEVMEMISLLESLGATL